MKLHGINVVTLVIAAILVILIGLIGTVASHQYWNLIWIILLALWTGILLHTITRGHARIWQDLVMRLNFGGHDQILDLCRGRLIDLLTLAKSLQLPAKVYGTGQWHQDSETVQKEVNAAQVADRVKLVDTDVFNLSFADRTFDAVLVDLAFHNISPALERGRAIQEASRVLKADGTLAIVDFAHIGEYQQMLANLGFKNIRVVNPGFNGWWGSPWPTTKVLIAKRL